MHVGPAGGRGAPDEGPDAVAVTATGDGDAGTTGEALSVEAPRVEAPPVGATPGGSRSVEAPPVEAPPVGATPGGSRSVGARPVEAPPVGSGSAEDLDAPSTRPLTVGIVLAVTMFAFDALAVTTIMPAVAADLGGVSLYGAVFSAFMLANIVSMVVSGHAADRRGPFTALAIGVAVFGGGLVAGALAPTMAVFVAARVLQGLGTGTVGATVYAAVGRAYPRHARSRLFAITSTAWVLPSLIGPSLAAAAAETVGWRWVFWGLLPVPALVAVLALPALRSLGPAPGAEAAGGIGRSAGLLVVGAGLALWGANVELAVPVPARAAAVVVGGVAAVRALRRVLPPGVHVARPGVAGAVATRSMLAGLFFVADTFLPLAITGVHGRSTLFAGVVISTASVAWSGAAWLQARSVDRLGLGRLLVAGFVLVAVGVAAATPVLSASVPVGVAVAAWAVAGFGMGLAYNSATVYGMNEAADGTEGRVGSQLQVGDALAIAVTTGLGGAIVGVGESAGWSVGSSLGFVWAGALGLAVVGIGAAARQRHHALT